MKLSVIFAFFSFWSCKVSVCAGLDSEFIYLFAISFTYFSGDFFFALKNRNQQMCLRFNLVNMIHLLLCLSDTTCVFKWSWSFNLRFYCFFFEEKYTPVLACSTKCLKVINRKHVRKINRQNIENSESQRAQWFRNCCIRKYFVCTHVFPVLFCNDLFICLFIFTIFNEIRPKL